MNAESHGEGGAHEHEEARSLEIDITAAPVAFSTLLASKPPKQGKAASATIISTVFHVAVVVVTVWTTMKVSEEVANAEEVQFVELVDEMAPPPPPPPPPVDQPQMQDVVRGFQTLTVPDIIPPDIPPPGAFTILESDFTGEGLEGGVEGRDSTIAVEVSREEPVFTPYTVAPELRNRDEVSRALEREYPSLLRDAGIGGRVVVWLFIDEAGAVQNTRVNEPSGHTSLDEAALRVANVMQFSPAMNRDKKVPVWVSLPITFQTR
ncbi:MAG: energy transducer TonB [Longimicrobiales bacterium]|nr:energy transducer TonB [Longimicrobiales bacterium]